jgi:3-deoxy-D-manno-octulosonic-acid transferase
MVSTFQKNALINTYSLIFTKVLTPITSIVGFFVESLKVQQFSKRSNLLSEKLVFIARKRRMRSNGILILCSSAGEYEQAKPLGDLFSKNNNFVIYVFFSINGLEFAKTRDESEPCILLPLEDLKACQELYLAVAPECTIVVRHELWPVFLSVASQHSQVWLVNALVPSRLNSRTRLRALAENKIKSLALKNVGAIVAGNKASQIYHRDILGFSDSKIFLCGDTKFDRVESLKQSRHSQVETLTSLIEQNWAASSQMKLVAGSVYTEDVKLILDALTKPGFEKCAAILVPHDISFSNVSSILNQVRLAGHAPELWSEVTPTWYQASLSSDSQNTLAPNSRSKPSVLIVDSLGLLSDLYAVADLAWIGGACHKKVHNVLEAIVCGIPTACGPNFKNSAEAIEAVDLGVLEVCKNADQLALFATKSKEQRGLIKEKLVSYVNERTGVFLKIYALITSRWRESASDVS